MSLNYTTFVAQLSNLMAASSTTTNFTTMLPGAIDYAEQRIYRELDLLHTQATDAGAFFTPNVRRAVLPTTFGSFITVQQVNAITPAGTFPDSNGTRSELIPTTKQFLDSTFNSVAGAGIPRFFAMQDDVSVIVGPWPDAAYIMEVVGTYRPAPLSATNPNTYLTLVLPDLFMAAAMIFASGYMRAFGAQSDNSGQAVAWEQQYQALFASANAEELRKKFASGEWTSLSTGIGQPKK